MAATTAAPAQTWRQDADAAKALVETALGETVGWPTAAEGPPADLAALAMKAHEDGPEAEAADTAADEGFEQWLQAFTQGECDLMPLEDGNGDGGGHGDGGGDGGGGGDGSGVGDGGGGHRGDDSADCGDGDGGCDGDGRRRRRRL